jgi:hypothetical protein
MREVICAFFADGFEEDVDDFGKFLLDFHIANLTLAIAFLEVVHFGVGGIERVVIDEDGIAFHGARVSGA